MDDEQPELVLPELTQGMMDRATLDAYVRDLAACADVLDVLVKGGTERRTDGAPVPLEEAVSSLMTGDVHGVQVRYRYDDTEWRDTLLWSPEGLRVVRIDMSAVYASGES